MSLCDQKLINCICQASTSCRDGHLMTKYGVMNLDTHLYIGFHIICRALTWPNTTKEAGQKWQLSLTGFCLDGVLQRPIQPLGSPAEKAAESRYMVDQSERPRAVEFCTRMMIDLSAHVNQRPRLECSRSGWSPGQLKLVTTAIENNSLTWPGFIGTFRMNPSPDFLWSRTI